MSDDLAKHATQGHATHPPPTIIEQLGHSDAYQWSWLLRADESTMTAYPSITKDHDGQLTMRFRAQNPQIPTTTDLHTDNQKPRRQQQHQARAGHNDPWHVALHLLSHNIGTMRSDTKATRARGDIAKAIRLQLRQMKVHIAAFQETRTPEQVTHTPTATMY